MVLPIRPIYDLLRRGMVRIVGEEETRSLENELGKVMDYTEKMRLDAMKFVKQLGPDKVKDAAKLIQETLK